MMEGFLSLISPQWNHTDTGSSDYYESFPALTAKEQGAKCVRRDNCFKRKSACSGLSNTPGSPTSLTWESLERET